MSWLSFSRKPKDGVEVVRPGEHAEHPVLVDPMWLLKAGILAVVAAAVCGYLALCLLFYQGQWQLVLHPAPMQTIPSGALPTYQEVHFATTESGTPTLFGWWIPSDPGSSMEADTLVYFPSGTGSISERTVRMNHLHQLRINVFAFDYRGFGNSAKLHPSQVSLNEDAVSAVRYLTDTRHIPPSHLVLMGEGLGCLPALHAANETPGIAAVILDSPRLSQFSVFQADPRTGILPLKLLIRDDFSLGADLQKLTAPKLILASIRTEQNAADVRAVYDAAANPKTLVDAPAEFGTGKFHAALSEFLGKIFGGDAAMPAAPENAPAPSASPEK
jgi:pimeloyl-ACP methyl ester carboxylesterase